MKYNLQDLIDIRQLQSLQERFTELHAFTCAILDSEGNILTATGWQDICTRFHRANPECAKECARSDRYIIEHLGEANPAVSYRCRNGLIDSAVPILIEGQHLGSIFTGQFFLEPPDLEFFRGQARKYGFDEEAYLDAVRKVPIWTRGQMDRYLLFITGLIDLICSMGLKHLRVLEARQRAQQSEAALEAEAIRRRILFEESPDGIVIIDPETARFLEFNTAAHRQLGYTREAFAQLSIMDIEARETPEETKAHIAEVLREGKLDFESIQRTRQGELRHVHVTAQIVDVGGHPVYHCIWRDITERKRAEEERATLQGRLNQAQKMESVGRLAGGVAHDFNNMLGVILGHTEMALEQLAPDQPLFAHLREIQKAAQQSAELTQQLLAFARKQTVVPRVLDLNATVEGMLKMLRRLIGENIDLTWKPGTGLWPLKVDPSQINQILANLCVNARDAIAGVGKVTIETQTAVIDSSHCFAPDGFMPGEYVLLSVSDSGCGMDPETLDNLFEPFYTTKGLGKGTGLGLATVYGIVKQNDGFIQVRSAPGEGSTFAIYLPRHAAATGCEGQEDPEKPARRGNETILLVEDEPAILDLCGKMLESLGYQVLAANTLGETMALAQKHAGTIHLLITDVIMPEMNGRDLARQLLSLYPDLKALFMSGYIDETIAHQGVLDEGIHFMPKPFSRKELGDKVREALGDL